MSRRFCAPQGSQRVFCMVGAWEIILTMLGTDPQSSMYKHLSTTYQWPCHAKLKYQLAGIFPFRFLILFCYFQSAIPAKSSVHTNFRRVHLNRKLLFLAGFAILRVCTAKRNRENAVFFNICLDLLMMASHCFIAFVCALHWNCSVHAIWPCARRFTFACA